MANLNLPPLHSQMLTITYQNLTATSDSLPSLAAHHDAIEQLIKNRGMSIMRDRISIGILFGVRSQMVSLYLFCFF
jgi:hypothetical protein